ncbi:MAG: ABC transporter ATP-binding protein [Armatimonadota bacterium]
MSGTDHSVAEIEAALTAATPRSCGEPEPTGQPVPGEALLVVREVSFSINGTQILSDVSFDVFPGEIFGVMGMSGSGKTTLLRLLIGLSRPTAGHIWFKGEDITRLDEDALNRVRKSMGMCFQYSALFDSMTVAQNVAFAMRNRRDVSREEVDARVAQLLDLVDMEGTQDRMPADLSGGMKKRVGIARALMQEPELVFYDEPTSGLDPIMACNITGLIRRVSEELGSTAVVVSHDVEHMMAIADRVMMLHDGRVQVIGTPDQLRECQIPIVHRFVHGVGTGPGSEFCPSR